MGRQEGNDLGQVVGTLILTQTDSCSWRLTVHVILVSQQEVNGYVQDSCCSHLPFHGLDEQAGCVTHFGSSFCTSAMLFWVGFCTALVVIDTECLGDSYIFHDHPFHHSGENDQQKVNGIVLQMRNVE